MTCTVPQTFFRTFNLLNHPSCNYDYVELREGDVHGRLIGRYCGTRFPGNLTAANGLWIKFRSDVYGSGTGFLAEFNTSKFNYLYGNTTVNISGRNSLCWINLEILNHW